MLSPPGIERRSKEEEGFANPGETIRFFREAEKLERFVSSKVFKQSMEFGGLKGTDGTICMVEAFVGFFLSEDTLGDLYMSDFDRYSLNEIGFT